MSMSNNSQALAAFTQTSSGILSQIAQSLSTFRKHTHTLRQAVVAAVATEHNMLKMS